MFHTFFFFFPFHRTQLFCYFDNLFWAVWCYFIKFVAEEGSVLWSSPRTVWSGSRSWMWRQCLLLRFPYCLARIKNEVDGFCRDLLLQLFFSLPLGSAALFLCGMHPFQLCCRKLQESVDYPVTPNKNTKFVKIRYPLCSVMFNLSESSSVFFFFLSELTHVYTFNRVKTVCC